jgi:hypothetical protein
VSVNFHIYDIIPLQLVIHPKILADSLNLLELIASTRKIKVIALLSKIAEQIWELLSSHKLWDNIIWQSNVFRAALKHNTDI